MKAKSDEKIGDTRPNRKHGDSISHAFFSGDGKRLAVFVRSRKKKNLTFLWYDIEKKEWSLDSRHFLISPDPGPLATPDHAKLFFQASPSQMTFIPLAP